MAFAARWALSFSLAIAVNGCAVFEPRVDLQDLPVVPGADPLFEAAVRDGNALRKDLHGKSVDLDRFEFWSGLGILGLGIAGLAIGVFDGSKDALLGVGVAGAGLVGLRAFVPTRERKRIYADGQLAVTCSITALSFASPPAVAPEGQPEALVSETAAGRLLDRPLERLEAIAQQPLAAMEELRAPMTGPAVSVEAAKRVIVRRAEDAAEAVRAVRSEFDLASARAGAALGAATTAIREAVNRQIDESTVDPNGAVAAAHAQYAGYLGQVTSTVGDAREKLRLLESAAEQGEEVADASEIAAPQVRAAAVETRSIAAEAAAAASDAQDALAEIIRRLQVPAACFPGFAVTGVQ